MTFTAADGLIGDGVILVVPDNSRAFICFCTLEGLSRFDGFGFTNYRTTDGLPDRCVNDPLISSMLPFLRPGSAGRATRLLFCSSNHFIASFKAF